MSRDDSNSGGHEDRRAAAAVTGWLARARRRRIALAGINGGAIGVTVTALAAVIYRLAGGGAAGWPWLVGGAVGGALGAAVFRRPGLTAVARWIDGARGTRHDEVLLAASFIPACGGAPPAPGPDGRTSLAALALVRNTARLLAPLNPARLVPLRLPPGRWALAGVAVVGLGLTTGIREPSASGGSVAAQLARIRGEIAEIVRRAGGAEAPERVRARAAELRRVIADLEARRVSPAVAEQRALAVAGGSESAGGPPEHGRTAEHRSDDLTGAESEIWGGRALRKDGDTATANVARESPRAPTGSRESTPGERVRTEPLASDRAAQAAALPGDEGAARGDQGAEGALAQEQQARDQREQKRVLEKLSRETAAERQLSDAARALANLARQSGAQTGGDQENARGEASSSAARQPAPPQGEKSAAAQNQPAQMSARGAAAQAFEARAAGTGRSAAPAAGGPGSEQPPGGGQPTPPSGATPAAREGEAASAAPTGAPTGGAIPGENPAGDTAARVDLPERSEAAASGAGIGSGAGGGEKAEAEGPGAGEHAGVEREVELAGGAGPSRSEVVEGSAARGFAAPPYQRVWGDYHGVVEETLERDAVPPARRQLVREYFHLIRPRTASRTGATP